MWSLGSSFHTAASATIGIVRRQGLGKFRYLNVLYLWLQERAGAGDIGLHKVPGLHNPADLLTKHLAATDMHRHVDALDMELGDGRAASAPQLSSMPTRPLLSVSSEVDAKTGEWAVSGNEVVMRHDRPRRQLFTPIRVRGAPPAKGLLSARITTGVYLDTGEEFQLTDNLRNKARANAELERHWIGRSKFSISS